MSFQRANNHVHAAARNGVDLPATKAAARDPCATAQCNSFRLPIPSWGEPHGLLVIDCVWRWTV